MYMRVGINGFGRIGRLVFRIIELKFIALSVSFFDRYYHKKLHWSMIFVTKPYFIMKCRLSMPPLEKPMKHAAQANKLPI